MNTSQTKGPPYDDLLKRCKQCEKLYGPGKRALLAFVKSKYCSAECTGLAQRNTLARLQPRIQADSATGCHVWSGTKSSNGYGQVTWNGRTRMVHRLIWESIHGELAPE